MFHPPLLYRLKSEQLIQNWRSLSIIGTVLKQGDERIVAYPPTSIGLVRRYGPETRVLPGTQTARAQPELVRPRVGARLTRKFGAQRGYISPC